MNRFLVLGILILVFFLVKKPEPPKPSIPGLIIRKVIFGKENDTSIAASASSSDDGAPASADDDSTPGPLTPEAAPFAATELELQMELVNQLVQIDELKKENERLKQAAQPVVFAAPMTMPAAPVCTTGNCQPARSTYGNYYSGNGYYYRYNNATPTRGIFRGR